MFWKRKNREQDVEREIRSHLDLEAAEQQEHGLAPEEARYAAQRALGNTTLVKENVRDMGSMRWLEDFFKDLQVTLRQLRKAPSFTAVAVLSLALGIGANTAIFTLIDAVLLKSLPVRDPGSLVVLGPERGSGDAVGIPRDGAFSLYSFDLCKQLANTHLFHELCAVQSSQIGDISVRLAGWSEPQLAQAKLVSGNYFQVLGINAVLGRTIVPSDDSSAAAPVAVISFRYWKDALHGDPSVIGSSVDLGSVPVSIIGVAPPAFYGETLKADPPGFWLPLSTDRVLNRGRALIDNPNEHWLYLIGRLQPGISTSQAQVRLTSSLHNWLLARQGSTIAAEDRDKILKSYITLTPGGSGITHMQREYSRTLGLLLGISIAVLLITCANIANLLLARGTARTAETSVRLALGAGRARLVRQLLTESITLALAGGALGLLVASVAAKLLLALFFRGADYVPIQTSPDLRILLFTFALSCAAAILFGLLPALRATSDIAPALKGASPAVKGGSLGHRPFGLGSALISAEVALSLVVLAAAGSFARTLANLGSQQFGFNRERVLIVNMDTAHAGYDYTRLAPLYRQLESRLNALPGIQSASLSYYSPFNNCCWGFSVSVQGYVRKQGESMQARLNRVSARYFETLGTHLLLGRTFNEHETPNGRRAAIVTQEFVRRFSPNQNPIGRRFGIGGEQKAGDLEIVGVVENAKYDAPREDLMPMAFLPLLQLNPDESASKADESHFVNVIELRSAGRPEMIAAEVRRALAEIDPRLPVLRVSTLSGNVHFMLNQENVITSLAGFFALLALLLSCLGLYGLMAYTVERRTSEMGIRLALGARHGAVIGMIVREALLQGVLGILLGIPAAFAALELVRNQLYGVSPADPTYSAAAALILLLCMALASYLPARRAARVDPLIALRYE